MIGSFGQILYDELGPMQYDEINQDFALMNFCGALGTCLDDLNDVVRETDTRPSWGLIFDADNAPLQWLPWMGQFSGTYIDPDQVGDLYPNVIKSYLPSLYWRLNETSGTVASDLSGNGRDGTYGSGVTLNQPSAIVDDPEDASALFNNNSNSYVSSTFDLSDLSAGWQRTWVGWAFRNANTTTDVILAGQGARHPLFQIYTGTQNVHFYSDNTVATYANWVNAWPGNRIWTHFALQIDDVANTAELFINGISKGKQTGMPPINPAAGQFWLGRQSGGPYWNGYLDEIAFYPRLLSPTEISQIYNASFSLSPGAQRAVIRNQATGWGRGRPASIAIVAQTFLTGQKEVIINERDTGAYHYGVITKKLETPSTYLLNAALQRAKPAGLNFSLSVLDLNTYAYIKSVVPNYAGALSTFSTYTGLRGG
jgi:hypothetical protein